MKKFVCVLLLITICLTLASCTASDATIRIVEVEKTVEVPVEVEVEKIVEVPVEVEVEKIVEVPVEVIKEVKVFTTLPEASCFSDYDWDNLKSGDFIENVLCNRYGAVAKDYKITNYWNVDSSYITYIYGYYITETVSISIYDNTHNSITGMATGTIDRIDRKYNEFGYLERIEIRLQ